MLVYARNMKGVKRSVKNGFLVGTPIFQTMRMLLIQKKYELLIEKSCRNLHKRLVSKRLRILPLEAYPGTFDKFRVSASSF